MTQKQFDKISKTLRSNITKKRNSLKNINLTLDEKVLIQKEIKTAKTLLRNHFLSYYDVVTA